jgi:hypothetical protein
MVYLSIDMATLYHQCHDTKCPPYSPQHATLYAVSGPILQAEILEMVVLYLPLLIGMFIGVPILAHEHEQGTLLLAWSQDVSPVRWLWTKLALLGLVVAMLTAVLAAVTRPPGARVLQRHRHQPVQREDLPGHWNASAGK